MTNEETKTERTGKDFYKLFKDGEDADAALFAEMRSNILLVSGDHWKKTTEERNSRIGQNSSLSEEIKIKLVKNHLGAIQDRTKAGVAALTPGVTPVPYNEDDYQDKKDAEISKSVWEDIRLKQAFEEKKEKWIMSQVDIGEMWSKTYFDPDKGELRGFDQEVDKDGNPLFIAPDGTKTVLPFDLITRQPFEYSPDESKPIFAGQVQIKLEWPMNCVRPLGCETLSDAPWLGIKSMMEIDHIKRLIPEDAPNREEVLGKIKQTQETTFKVFDCSKGEYSTVEGQALVREQYWRPCYEYPYGWYVFMIEEAIIIQGKLPHGIFPLDHEINEEIPTSPRGRSRIKRLRPGQVEINRLASQQAYHQIALGDDKIITQNGSILTKGQKFDGIRQINVNGEAPTIMAGRSGNQFESSLNREIVDLYKIANLDYEERSTASQDLNVQIYQSMSQRAKYNPQARKIERFLVKVAQKAVLLSKETLDEQDVIRIAGKRETLNVAEFKEMDDVGYSIKMMPVNDDLESMFGRQSSIRDVLQYSAGQMRPEFMAKLIKGMPFLSKDEVVSQITINEDIVTNDILSLDRGVYRPPRPTDKHDYMIEMLTHRTRKQDYEFLPPEVHILYDRRINEHAQMLEQNVQKLKALQDRMIPTSGPLVKVDLYQNVVGQDGQITQKVQKMNFPMSSLLDLAQKMQAQGEWNQITSNLDAPTQIELLNGSYGGQQQQGMSAQPAVPQQQQGANAMAPGSF